MTIPIKLPKELSLKFRFWAFVSMVLLVFVHGYNLDQRYLQPWTTPMEPMTVTSFVEYFLANGIFRFRIPMLFIISGYLYAWYAYEPYGKRTLKRVRTLLVPYLIWSAIGLLTIFLLERWPTSKQWVLDMQLMYLDENRLLLSDYKWYEVLGRWIVFPVPYQLWFIRVLFFYNLGFPVIAWLINHKIAKWIFWTFAILFWLTTGNLLIIDGEGLLFFSLGVWLQQRKFPIFKAPKGLNPWVWFPFFLIVAALKTVLAFKGYALLGDRLFITLTLLHKFTVIAGLFGIWYSSSGLVFWLMEKWWIQSLTRFSFIIYAAHAPIVALLIDPFMELIGYGTYTRILTFICLPILVIVGSIAVGWLLKKIMPSTYQILTGNRG